MTAARLQTFVEMALSDNQRRLSQSLGRSPELKEVLGICRNFRIAGIGALFLSGTSEAFLWRLHQSARCYAHFLPKLEETAKRTGHSLPFFDAITARDLVAAREIALHSRRSWAQGVEYEEDFLFVEFLMQHFFLNMKEEDCRELLQRYETALQGSEDFRLDVCKALLDADEASFGTALTRFLAGRGEHIEEVREAGYMEDDLHATEGQLSVEGLALVMLAEQKGLATEEDYLHVPSIAREPPARVFSEDSWRHIQ